MSILNKYKRWNPLLSLKTDRIYDFVISQNNTNSDFVSNSFSEDCLSAFIDVTNDMCISGNTLLSHNKYFWVDSKSDGVVLKNIGFTGIDNGLVKYNPSLVSNKQFLDILTKSEYVIDDNDKRLRLTPVVSNSECYSFESELKSFDGDRFVSLYGGFYQGFFKLYNYEYQVLPHKIDDSWSLEFVIRPKDYEIKHNTLNGLNPQNKGIFFYIGTRAENKFLRLYSYDLSSYTKRDIENKFIDSACGDYYGGYYIVDDDAESGDIRIEMPSASNIKDMLDVFYNSQETWVSECCCSKKEKVDKTDKCELLNDGYFSDSYMENPIKGYFGEGYLEDDIVLDENIVTDRNGNDLSINGYYEINTDNKFIIFNGTKDGFNTDTWNDEDKYVLTGVSSTNNYNLFLLLNKTKTGFTTDTIDKYFSTIEPKKPNINKDITNNAFALKINEDYSIGYRYLVSDCDSSDGFSLLEERSLPDIIKNEEWNVVNVKIKNMGSCMKLFIYVNGFLKFVSKELPVFKFRELDEVYDKQEGVPYNISLGGGTQGLSDSLWLDYHKPFEYILPLEKYFAGTFVGDIKSFKFYTCGLPYDKVKNNFNYEQSLLK